MSLNTSVNAKFVKQDNGLIKIEFFDPAYVRSDLIFLDEDNHAHALLHEKTHRIGAIDDAFHQDLVGLDEIVLSAKHYNGSEFQLKAPLHKAAAH